MVDPISRGVENPIDPIMMRSGTNIDCPWHKAALAKRLPRTCRNPVIKNMSDLRRHAARGTRPHLSFLRQCRTCRKIFTSQRTFELEHGYTGEFCVEEAVDDDPLAQWRQLYNIAWEQLDDKDGRRGLCRSKDIGHVQSCADIYPDSPYAQARVVPDTPTQERTLAMLQAAPAADILEPMRATSHQQPDPNRPVSTETSMGNQEAFLTGRHHQSTPLELLLDSDSDNSPEPCSEQPEKPIRCLQTSDCVSHFVLLLI